VEQDGYFIHSAKARWLLLTYRRYI